MNTPDRGLAWRNDVLDTVLQRLADDPDALVRAAAVDGQARSLVRQFADLLCNRRRLTLADLEGIEALGGVQAAAGLPLDDMLRDVRAAMAAAWRHLVALTPSTASAEAAVDAVGRMAQEALDFAQRSTEAVARGHAARARLGALARPGDSGADPFDSEADLARRLDGAHPYGLVVFTLPAAAGDDPAPLAGALCAITAQVRGGVGGRVRSDPALHAACAVPAGEWRAVVQAAEAVAAGHGAVPLMVGPALGAAALYDSYLDVVGLVPVARQVAATRTADDIDVYRFLAGAGPEEAQAFVRRVLGPLLDLPDDEVATLLDRVDHDPAARHRVEQATGLVLDRPLDRLRLRTAAVLRRHEWVPPSA